MRVELFPPGLSVVPGKPSTVTVRVTNTSSVISGHELRVLGLDPNWVRVDQDRLSLFPDASGDFTVTVVLPLGLPAGTRTLEIEVRELTPPNEVSRSRFEVTIPEQPDVSVVLDPVSVNGGTHAHLGVIIENTGNSPIDVHLAGADDESKITYEFTPNEPHLEPGDQLITRLHLRAKRPWFGNPKVRTFTVEAGPAKAPVIAHGAWIQHARLTRGNLSLIGLAIAATVFTVVLAATLSSVVSQSNADRDLALQVASANHAGAAAGTSSIAGVVQLLSSNAPLSGITVDVFTASSTSSPIASTATNASGGYAISGLNAGSYKLSYVGAGFVQLWYPDSLSAQNAGVVTLNAKQQLTGVNIHLGGEPATISGQVVGANTTGALLSLELPAGGAPGNVALPSVGTSPAGNTGAASSASSSSTAGNTGTSSSGGSSSTAGNTGASSSGGSSSTAGNTGASSAGGSSTAGNTGASTTVFIRHDATDTSGPSGATGASSPADTSGSDATAGNTGSDASAGNTGSDASGAATPLSGTVPAIVTTETLDSSGNFTLANVPSPAVYDLVVTEAGYAPATQEIDLGGGENRSGVIIELHKGDGSISGTVDSSTGPLGGATISATNGSTTVNTITATTPSGIGTFTLSSLPTPTTLTLTVSATGYASETLTVTLAAAQQVTGIAVTLLPGVGSISGTVTTPTGSAVGGVTVTASNGSLSVSTATLSTGQPGSYQLTGLPVPGTYTVTFSRADLASQTQQVILSASGNAAVTDVNATMVSMTASISGVVSDQGGAGVSEVAISLVNGSKSYAVTSANAPTVGSYEIDGIIPGTYNLSFTRQGGVPTSVIVTLTAGQNLTENETLTPAASIYGYVDDVASGQPVPGAQINLYLSTQYPTVISSTTTTNSSGEFTFANVDAPQSFIVSVSYPAGSSAQETVLITTSLGVASPACGSNATGAPTTTTTAPGGSTTTSSSTTTSTSTTTTLPTSSSSCNAQSSPLLVTIS